MNRGIMTIALVAMLAVALPIWTEDCGAEYVPTEQVMLHFDYRPLGEAYVPAHTGEPPIYSNVESLVAMGTWHYLVDDAPWSPDDVVSKDRLDIVIDVAPVPPEPYVPPQPEPTPTPTPTPTPDPEPSDDTRAIDPRLIGAGIAIGVVAFVAVLYWAIRRL